MYNIKKEYLQKGINISVRIRHRSRVIHLDFASKSDIKLLYDIGHPMAENKKTNKEEKVSNIIKSLRNDKEKR